MKKLYVLLILGMTQVALAGGPRVKFFTEKHGALESSPARDAIRAEVSSRSELGGCYRDFFAILQNGFSYSKGRNSLKCYLKMMKMPLTLEITFYESNVSNALIEIPELKISYLSRSDNQTRAPSPYYCARLADRVVSDLKTDNFPFARNFEGAITEEFLSTLDFFERNECNF